MRDRISIQNLCLGVCVGGSGEGGERGWRGGCLPPAFKWNSSNCNDAEIREVKAVLGTGSIAMMLKS